MKRTLFTLFICGIFVITMQGQYVTIEGRQFKDENGEDFYPVVCNYIVNYFFTTNTTQCFISPQSDGWGYECDDAASCDTQFYHNFLQLKHMKFNTIRLFGTTPVYVDTSNNSKPGFRITAFHNTNLGPNPSISEQQFYLSSPYESDSIVQRIFSLIDRILVQADHAGLKVILLSGGAKGRFYPELDTAYYPEFLSALSHHIANHSPTAAKNALLAYDLFNEPGSSDQMGWPWSAGHYKRDICNRVANWYNAVKSNDSSHLITMGAGGIDDILEYDLSSMKLDFASPHFYPKKTAYEPDSARFNSMMNRVKGILYWLGKNSQMPFLIGETGFSAQAGVSPDSGTHGDTSEQRHFAETTLHLTRDCSGSGYSWWKYQNSYWGFSIYEDSFGLLDGGFCTPPCNALEKPVVNAFENFNPAGALHNCNLPNNYYDPWNYMLYSPDTVTNTIFGTVKDKVTGLPIIDAVVFGSTLLGLDNNNQPISEMHYTFTDSLGNFKIIPYNYASFDTNKVNDLYISSPGSERICKQAYDPWLPLINNDTYELFQQRWDFDGIVNNSIIYFGVTDAIQGWNTLSLSNVYIENGTNVTYCARKEIEVDNEFEALSGSEVTITCSQTFPICSEYLGFQKKSTIFTEAQSYNETGAKMELSFILPGDVFEFSIFPNPNNGIFTVKIETPSSLIDKFKIEIINFLGVKVVDKVTNEKTIGVNITSYSKGVYLIKISSESDEKTKIFIFQ